MCLKYALGLALTLSLAAFAQAQPTAARPPPPQYMQERLELTPEQRKDLHVRIDRSSPQMQDIYRLGAIDGDKGLQFYRDYQKQYQEEEFYQFLIPDPVNPLEMAWMWAGKGAKGFDKIIVSRRAHAATCCTTLRIAEGMNEREADNTTGGIR